MPLLLPGDHPTLIIRRSAFERVGLVRATIDQRLGLTDQEFRVEAGLIVVGPVHDDDALQNLVSDLESSGLVHYEDFFDMSGNWPDWMRLFVGEREGGPHLPDDRR